MSWLDEEVEFYDFIWDEGLQLCGKVVNKQLMDDFAKGGSLFEDMKKKITEKFPTRESALKAFKKK